MNDQAAQERGVVPPQVFNGPPLRVELSINGPIHIHNHGQGVSAEDIVLFSHLESILKRAVRRLKAVDERMPAK